jgi:hypothetical protein
MMRVDDVVTDLEIDALRLAGDIEVFQLLRLNLGDGVLLIGVRPNAGRPTVSCLQIAIHEVDLL